MEEVEQQNRRLRATISKLLDHSIYPKSVVSKDSYKERSDWQNGYNEGACDILKRLQFAEKHILKHRDLIPPLEKLLEDYVCSDWCNRIQGISEKCNCGVKD